MSASASCQSICTMVQSIGSSEVKCNDKSPQYGFKSRIPLQFIHSIRGIRLMVDHGHTSIKLKYSESYRPTWGPGRRIRIPTQAAYLSG